MKELSLNEIRKIELNILKQFHELCIEKKLRYSLCGGTLLGAIRHEGFIPWDDDVDVFMPRPDYEKLIEYCKIHETPFKLVSNKTEKKYRYLFAKATDRNTIIEDQNLISNDVKMGVYIDIFPIDGLGKSLKEAKKNFLAKAFQRELLVASNWRKFFFNRTKAWYYEFFRLVFFLLSRGINVPNLMADVENYYSKISFDSSQYAACVCGVYRMREIGFSGEFSELTNHLFENENFYIIKEYDKYLRRIFGEYMELPPKDEQKCRHTFKAYIYDVEVL